MAIQLVTAIYSKIHGTNFNGSPDAIYERYRQSLRSMAKGGYNIVCYTSELHFDELTEFYSEFPNLTVVKEELTEFYYHNEINRIKALKSQYTKDTSWYTRCVEIMWGKMYWLMRHAALLTENDHIFWIDAGIFHSGMFTDKWKSEKSDNFFDFDRITQEHDLYAGLSKHAGEKILNIICKHPNHGSDDYMEVVGHDFGRPQYGVIGGIFGGRRDVVLEYTNGIIDMMPKALEKDILLKEEELMHYMHASDPDKFSIFTFGTWYHEEWDAAYRRGETVSFSDYFEFLRN